MSENKICVYAICKNESKFVERWLESIKDADYIVVLDTGSTDDTYEKFTKYANTQEFKSKLTVKQKVIDPWRFDDARNESLKMAYLIPDANIFFSMDIDEIVRPGWNTVLKDNWIEGKHERVMYKYTWSHTEDGAEGRSFNQDKIHSRNWRWNYPVHELLVPKSSDVKYTYNELLNVFDKMHVEHYPDSTKSRSSYLPLLELRLLENPDDLTTEMYLGHEYYYKGFYDKSIKLLNKALIQLPSTGIDTASTYLFIGDSYKSSNDIVNAKLSYYHAIYSDETYIEPYIALGHIYYDNKDYDNAIYILKSGLKKSYRHYSWLERDSSWSYEPWDLLSLACFYNGNKKDSLAYAIKAYSFDQNNKRLLDNINQILLYSNDSELL